LVALLRTALVALSIAILTALLVPLTALLLAICTLCAALCRGASSIGLLLIPGLIVALLVARLALLACRVAGRLGRGAFLRAEQAGNLLGQALEQADFFLGRGCTDCRRSRSRRRRQWRNALNGRFRTHDLLGRHGFVSVLLVVANLKLIAGFIGRGIIVPYPLN